MLKPVWHNYVHGCVLKFLLMLKSVHRKSTSSSCTLTQPDPAPREHRLPRSTSTNKCTVPHLKEPPPGSFSLFFWAAATCVETVAIALFPGNTAGFTTGTVRRKTTFVLCPISTRIQIYKPVTCSNSNVSGAKTQPLLIFSDSISPIYNRILPYSSSTQTVFDCKCCPDTHVSPASTALCNGDISSPMTAIRQLWGTSELTFRNQTSVNSVKYGINQVSWPLTCLKLIQLNLRSSEHDTTVWLPQRYHWCLCQRHLGRPYQCPCFLRLLDNLQIVRKKEL